MIASSTFAKARDSRGFRDEKFHDPPPKYPDVGSRFWVYLHRHKAMLGLIVMGNVFTVFISMATPLFVKLVIDEAIPGKNVQMLAGLVGAYFILQILRVFVGYGYEYLTQYVGQKTVFDIRRNLFHHLQLLHLSFYEKERTSSLVNRVIHDAAAIQNFISTAFSTITNSLVSLLVALGIMIVLNWKLTLFCLLFLPVYFYVIHTFRRRLRIKHHEVKERQSHLAGLLGETFSGIRVVKSFAQEDHERRRFVLRIKDNFYSELELPMIAQRMLVRLDILSTFSYAVVLLWAGVSVISGSMTIGGYVAYTSYLLMLFAPIRNLSALMQTSTNARSGFERILTLFDTKPKIQEDDNAVILSPIKGHVQYEHVHFSYDSKEVLSDISLDVQPGEIVALVGSSGSGKSTMMSLLTRFYDVTSGRILIDGEDLRRLKYDLYRQQLGIVLQENFLFTGTVDENIRYGKPEASDKEVLQAAKLANALEFIREMPKGFQSYVGQGGVTLSGGQRQRIAIARCILKNPRILIFDEATSALDNESEALIQASMDHLMKDRTVFIVAHRLTTIQKAHRIVVMEHGRIVEIGTHQELMDKGGKYSSLHTPKVHEDELLITTSPIRA